MPAPNATTAPRLGRSSGFAASLLPEMHRSEAFVEDLFDSSAFMAEQGSARQRPAGSRWQAALMCGVPVLVALLGGVVAFFHGLG